MRMRLLLNPFSRISGLKALVWGEFFVLALTVLFVVSDIAQDGFMHFTILDCAAWKVLVMNHLAWLIFATLLYLAGCAFPRTKVRAIDLFGSIGFTQLLLIPMNAVLYIPAWRNSILDTLAAVTKGVMPDNSPVILLTAMGVWSLVWLILYIIWSYKAFASSCNICGTKAIVKYIAVWIITSACVTPLAKLIYQ